MELHQLVYFVAVARHLHFSRAAEELHVAQPSVSQQIRKLERELGSQLFHRMKRRVALTPAGEAFLPRARQVLADLQAARVAVQEVSALDKGSLAVGATPSVGTHLLPRVLAEYHRRYPGIELTFRQGGSRTLVQWLEAGELDLAVIILPVGHPVLETIDFLEEELVLAVPPGHHLAGRERVRMAELRDEAFVMFREGYDLREATLEAGRRAGFEPRVAIDGGEMDSALSFVAAGLGVAVVPAMVFASASRQGPKAVRIDEPRLQRRLAIAYRRDRYLSAAARALITLALGARGRRATQPAGPGAAVAAAASRRPAARARPAAPPAAGPASPPPAATR